MTDGPAPSAAALVRDLVADDLPEVVRIDALHTGRRKPAYWRRVVEDFLRPEARPARIGLAAAGAEGLEGFLFGEVRAFEFGSEACGWVFAFGVEPARQRRGTASALLRAAEDRFRGAGVRHVRTMVRRNDVPVLSFFRANGWQGGPFVQLERDLQED